MAGHPPHTTSQTAITRGLKPYVLAMCAFLVEEGTRNSEKKYAREQAMKKGKPDPSPTTKNKPIGGLFGEDEPINTVSIEGGWGIGKSTFSGEVIKQLREEGHPVVEFKPWLHGESEALWVDLAATFHRDMRAHLSRRDYYQRMLGLWWTKNLCWGLKHDRRARLGASTVAVLTLILIIFNAWIYIGPWRSVAWAQLGEHLERAGSFLGTFTAVLAGIAAASKFIPAFMRSKPDETSHPPPMVCRLETDFAQLVNALCPNKKKNSRAFIFVDDLDRCTALGVTDTLRALGVLLNEGVNATVVLAVDRDRVAASLAAEDHHTTHFFNRDRQAGPHNGLTDAQANHDRASRDHDHAVRSAHQYLEKFIEASFVIPAMGENSATRLLYQLGRPDQDLSEFIKTPGADIEPPSQENLTAAAREWMSKGIQDAAAVAKVLDGNPRRIKLWWHNVQIRVLTLHALGRLADYDHRMNMAGLVTLQQIQLFEQILIVWPQLVRDLRRDPTLLRKLAEYAGGGKRLDWPMRIGNARTEPVTVMWTTTEHWLDKIDTEQWPRTILGAKDSTQTALALKSLDSRLLLLYQEPFAPPRIQGDEGSPPDDGGPEHPGGSDPKPDPSPTPAGEPVAVVDELEAPLSAEPDDPSPAPTGQSEDRTSEPERTDPTTVYGEEVLQAKRILERVDKSEGKGTPAYADALLNLGVSYSRVGELDRAEETFHMALEIEERLGRIESIAMNYGNLGDVLKTRGDLDGAEAMHRKALVLNERLGHIEGMASDYSNLGNVLKTRGDLDSAAAMYRKALELNDHLGRIEGMAINYGNLGNVLKIRGDLDGAEAMHARALELNERLGRIEGMATNYGNLGNVCSARGDLDGAEPMYRKALELNERLGHIEGMAANYGNLGNVLKTRGDLEGAEAMYRKALKLFGRLGSIEGMAHVYDCFGALLRSRGDLDGAESMYTRSLDSWSKLASKAHPSVILVRCQLSVVRSQQLNSSPPIDEMVQALRVVLSQRPAISDIPVIIGRLLRTAGGDPVAIVAEVEGEDAAKKYAEILDSDMYPE